MHTWARSEDLTFKPYMQEVDLGEGEGDTGAKEAQLLETWKAYKKNFQDGVALFNQKPKKGIAFMQVRPPVLSMC